MTSVRSPNRSVALLYVSHITVRRAIGAQSYPSGAGARSIIVWRAVGGAWGGAVSQLGLSHSTLEYLYYY